MTGAGSELGLKIAARAAATPTVATTNEDDEDEDDDGNERAMLIVHCAELEAQSSERQHCSSHYCTVQY
jgi:hypothetical protein